MRRLETHPPNSKPILEQLGAAPGIEKFSLSAAVRSARCGVKDPAVAQPQPTRRSVVSIPDRKLALPEDGRVAPRH
jgi:hypothetical protein